MALAALLLAASLLGQVPPVPPGTIFRFADLDGAVHFTDRLGDVPEPYYSMYLAELRTMEEKGAQSPAPVASPAPKAAPRTPASGESPSEKQIRERQYWKALVTRARAELKAATDAVESTQRELDELLAQNPTLRYTPQLQPRIDELEASKNRAVVRLTEARKALLEELPLKARREGVPAAWLQ